MKSMKISSYVMYAVMAISVVVLALFFFVGYDTPYQEDPKFNDPQFTDLLMVWMGIMIVMTFVLTIASVVMQVKNASGTEAKGIAGKTGLISSIALVLSILIGLGVGMADQSPVLVNGEVFTDPVALCITDTCLISMLILMILSVVAIFASMVLVVKK